VLGRADGAGDDPAAADGVGSANAAPTHLAATRDSARRAPAALAGHGRLRAQRAGHHALAKWIGTATEHLAVHVGSSLGGLLNATFGNATKLIIALFALRAVLIPTECKTTKG
jgi:hypothetical protein